MHCWNILKDKPKWMDKRKKIAAAKKTSNKKQKTAANSSPASLQPAAPADGVCDAQPSGRPAGKKKEKQKLRHGRTIETVDYLMEKKKEANIERELKKEERCQKAFTLQEERIKLEREKFEFKKKEAEKERRPRRRKRREFLAWI
uniref:No apical meristem-associated C-terminal domain-containing protein n=2 Tax=Oryza brachyantha TaxID=4533 RepID=J3KYJ6_ORYBR